MNKDYNLKASTTLMQVRQNCWYWQYWLILISLILMYPTSILNSLKLMHSDQADYVAQIEGVKYWLFWFGLYTTQKGSQDVTNLAPVYVLITVLVLDKISQGWQNGRYGCTLDRIREFKQLEEEVACIREKRDFNPVNSEEKANSIISKLEKTDSDYITVMEAKNECARIEILYRDQTNEVIEARLKEELILGLKRKYTSEFRFAVKFLMEQMSLQLLLFSCAHKSNIFSIFYLILLLIMIKIAKKATGMRYIIFAVSANVVFEYMLTLTNMTNANSPMEFPSQYTLTPCKLDATLPTQISCPEDGGSEFLFPLFMKSAFLRENLDWALFLGIDVQFFKVNDMWFDIANILLCTLYFFKFGNQSKILANSKVSLSKTSRLEKKLRDYTKL